MLILILKLVHQQSEIDPSEIMSATAIPTASSVADAAERLQPEGRAFIDGQYVDAIFRKMDGRPEICALLNAIKYCNRMIQFSIMDLQDISSITN